MPRLDVPRAVAARLDLADDERARRWAAELANRVTCESGSDLPKKSGCLTLVTLMVPVDRPLSVAGFEMAGQRDRVVGHVGGVVDESACEPPSSTMNTWIG